LRSKHRVCELIDLQQCRPLVHVSGRFGRDRHGLALVLQLGWHPRNRNALIVWDLAVDPQLLQQLSAEELCRRLYTRTEDLAPGEQRPGLKLVHVNKCPVLADAKVLRAQDVTRLQLDMETQWERARWLTQWRTAGQQKLAAVYAERAHADQEEADPETQLYGSFTSDSDRQLLPAIREADARSLTPATWPLQDQRLVDMLQRYRARNFPESLSSVELTDWLNFCRQKLNGEIAGAPLTFAGFFQD